jgi:predicted nucleotidyltransferase
VIEHLNKEELAVILDLASIGSSIGVPLMLVGANARRLGFDIPFGFPSPRSTQDWDFAAPMQDWAAFARFYTTAVQGSASLFRPGGPAHRIIHQRIGIMIDLVPFGQLTEGTGQIRWPQSDQVMSVLGFEEAFESCIRVPLPNDAEIRVVTPALLVALKLVAFSERGGKSSRDLHDIWFIMERYAWPPTNEARAYDEMVGISRTKRLTMST